MADSECVFCAIVAGEADALVVDERDETDERPGTLAFAPLHPVAPGHVLVIPKAHHVTLFDVPAKSLACRFRGGERGFDGANLLHDSTEYQSVPHFHLHVVARRDGDADLLPGPDRDSEREDAYAAVRAALES